MNEPDCLFCKISAGEIPADIVYEDDKVLAFRDIAPKAPTHILVIPKRHIATINNIREEDAHDVGLLFAAAAVIAKQEDIADEGYRAVMNCNEAAGQTVFHLHLHILGGRSLDWPPG